MTMFLIKGIKRRKTMAKEAVGRNQLK